MAVILRNTRAGEPVPKAPRRDDGTRYRFELIFDAGQRRAYADDWSELCACVIDGYAALDEPSRAKARIATAKRAARVLSEHLVSEARETGTTPPHVRTDTDPAPTDETAEDWVIRTGTDEALMRSLHEVGLVSLAEARPA